MKENLGKLPEFAPLDGNYQAHLIGTKSFQFVSFYI